MRLFLLIFGLIFTNFSNAAAVDDEFRELKVTVVTPSPLIGRAALLVSGHDNKTYEWLHTVVPSSAIEKDVYKVSVSFLINIKDRQHIRGIRFIRPDEVNVSLCIHSSEWVLLYNLTH